MLSRRRFLIGSGLALLGGFALGKPDVGRYFGSPPGGTPLAGPTVLTSAPAGGWTWYTTPMGWHHSGVDYFSYAQGDNGHGYIRTYTESSGVVSAATDIRGTIQIDDHAVPSILRRNSDGRIMVFYCAHGGSGFYHKVSTNPDDTSAFGSEVNIDSTLGLSSYTYSQPIQLTGVTNEPIFVFFRDSTAAPTIEWYYTKSINDGATWSAPVLVLQESGQAPYMKAVRNGTSRIDFVATEHAPNGAGVTSISVWHFYFDGTAGTFHKSDGTSLTLPASSANMTRVYDGTTVMAALEDIAIDGSGNPVIVYTRYVNVATDHRYDYARWTGSAWDVHQICTAGGGIDSTGYYSGGVALSRADPQRVFASRGVTSQFEMHLYVTADGGATFSDTALTSSSASKQIRPSAIAEATASPEILWMSGTYTGFLTYSVGTTAY